MLDYPLGDASAKVPVTVMANVLGAEEVPAMGMDERLHHLIAGYPKRRCTCTRSLSAQAQDRARQCAWCRWRRLTGWRTATSPTCVSEPAGQPTRLARGEWTDGWNEHGVNQPGRADHGQRQRLAGDGGRSARTGRVRRCPRGRRGLRPPHAEPHARLCANRRGPGPEGDHRRRRRRGATCPGWWLPPHLCR